MAPVGVPPPPTPATRFPSRLYLRPDTESKGGKQVAVPARHLSAGGPCRQHSGTLHRANVNTYSLPESHPVEHSIKGQF